MSPKTTGSIVAAVGVIILLVSALADVFSLGTDPDTFGWLQIVGVVVGAVVIAAGAAIVRRAGPGGMRP